MVDPDRKINRLTDEDLEFLSECEHEFGNRFTPEDAIFMEHCSKEMDEPPIVENWGGDGYDGGDSSGQRQYRDGGNNRGWRRGGGGHYNDNRRPYPPRSDHYNKYESNSYPHEQQRHTHTPQAHYYQAEQPPHGHQYHQPHGQQFYQPQPATSTQAAQRANMEPRSTPMHIRRDYGNFVPASKD